MERVRQSRAEYQVMAREYGTASYDLAESVHYIAVLEEI